jgi:hypothetical protein
MSRQHPAQSRELSHEEPHDARNFRAVIAAALATTPPDDEESLRRGVWNYVRAERDRGTSPGSVMVALTELVDESKIRTALVRQSVMRRVTRWCVQAYFGYLRAEAVGAGVGAPSVASVAAPPMIASNR